MVTTCCVKGCKTKAGENVEFHRFPEGEFHDKWITVMKLHNPLFVFNKNLVVCELHFHSDLDYEITHNNSSNVYQSKQLKKTAIPSCSNLSVCGSLLCNNLNSQGIDENEIVKLSLTDLHNDPLKNPLPPLIFPESSESSLVPSSSLQSSNSYEQISWDNKKQTSCMRDSKQPVDIDSLNTLFKNGLALQKTAIHQNKRIECLNKEVVDLTNRIKKLDHLVNNFKSEDKMITDN